MTVTVCIGNSDDRLTQREWHLFYLDVDNVIDAHSSHIHFSGSPPSVSRHQNACWVFKTNVKAKELQESLIRLCRLHKQDSIAWVEGETKMLH